MDQHYQSWYQFMEEEKKTTTGIFITFGKWKYFK